jgi:hypothetical protein
MCQLHDRMPRYSHTTPCTSHATSCTSHATPCTSHTTPCASHATPCTLELVLYSYRNKVLITCTGVLPANWGMLYFICLTTNCLFTVSASHRFVDCHHGNQDITLHCYSTQTYFFQTRYGLNTCGLPLEWATTLNIVTTRNQVRVPNKTLQSADW